METSNRSNLLFLTQFRTENRYAFFLELLWLPMKE